MPQNRIHLLYKQQLPENNSKNLQQSLRQGPEHTQGKAKKLLTRKGSDSEYEIIGIWRQDQFISLHDETSENLLANAATLLYLGPKERELVRAARYLSRDVRDRTQRSDGRLATFFRDGEGPRAVVPGAEHHCHRSRVAWSAPCKGVRY